MKLFLTASSERGKAITKSGNEYIEIVLTVDKKDFCTLVLKEKQNIVAPMNYHQNTDGYVLEIKDLNNKQVYYKLK